MAVVLPPVMVVVCRAKMTPSHPAVRPGAGQQSVFSELTICLNPLVTPNIASGGPAQRHTAEGWKLDSGVLLNLYLVCKAQCVFPRHLHLGQYLEFIRSNFVQQANRFVFKWLKQI
ncbi:hypothetical protein HanXRQr2_Chr14g0643141 [Helianthus annuus]|uniref:Uncharacterized protein n=1 Tax=Helianthus annuus TaxID=4232 RepID=A0A9K3H7J8_HELAN|nr:hypothetical protein HanXRQr2_Chr14g0643141 [Helianthus annuus]KAJ0464130.1 hypothetical protein HanHA300_Chr14g0523551 [Helianthus annuus]KAJ0468542.1 hypothetical protein HanIR_Chr14g0697791 [Helianthus annuus]KAJ0485677.1 hypothetical protein HanHA89_Chr14g0571011 [Helianthus annuus]KAJ0656230.1 hypothetical protein HanLR1_Chr14g0533411 [Helianthus annuus]